MADFSSSARFAVPPEKVYASWIDGAGHAEMTGAPASSDPRVGGAFSCWEGYISGTYTELVPARRIAMNWRTAQFPADAPDAHVVVELWADGDGTKLVLTQSGSPADQVESYRAGWEQFYFSPMRARFGG